MKSEYDVVIVGGGPAGLTAARAAAGAGVDVLLVETHREIGKPLLCAEGISVEGLSQVVEPDDDWICSRITGIKLISPNGECLYMDHPEAGFTIDRTRFEPHLARMAVDAGAEIVTDCRADDPVRDNGRFTSISLFSEGARRDVRFRILIAADGVESVVARKAGLVKHLLPSRLASCAQYRLEDIDVDSETTEMHFDCSIAPGGYIWVFPKGSHFANVGLGFVPTLAEDMNPFDMLDRFVGRRFESFRIAGRMMGVVPLFEGRRTMLRGNVMAVGDAARVVDSLSGAGIATALYSGLLAGEAAGVYVRSGKTSALRDYPGAFMAVFGRRLRMYLLAHQILRRMKPSEIDAVIEIAGELLGGRKIRSLDPVGVIKRILMRKPGLLRIAPRIVWK